MLDLPEKEADGERSEKYGFITTERKRLHPGEPVFLLRATDPIAPALIEEYAKRLAARPSMLSRQWIMRNESASGSG